MLPPPPVLAPPLGAEVALALTVVSGAGGAVVGLAELGTGTGLDGAGLDLQVQVGVGVGVGGVGVGVGLWWQPHVGVGVGVGVGVWVWQPHLPGGDGLLSQPGWPATETPALT
jgi:hypothetical protein